MLAALLLFVQTETPKLPPALPPLHGGPVQMTCPVGGETFEALQTNSYSTYGARPDGKPESYWLTPLPIPECPTNKLVLLQAYDAPTVAKLTRIVASHKYRALAGDSTYYRAQWLATRIGWPETRALNLLLSATWQVKPATFPTGQSLPSPEKARRYQAEFVARVRALPRGTEMVERRALAARAANALRELGHFEGAEAMRREALYMAGGSDEGSTGWRSYLTSLAAVIARRDDAIEPVDMVSDVRASFICIAPEPQSAFTRSWCAAPERQTLIANARRMQAMAAPKASK